MRNKLLILALVSTFVITGCSSNTTKTNKTTDSQINNEIEEEEIKSTESNKVEEETTKKELEEYQLEADLPYERLEKELIVDQRITFNGYTFMLDSSLDDFIKNTQTIVENQEELDEFINNEDGPVWKSLECYVLNNEQKIVFEITARRNKSNEIIISEISIRDDSEDYETWAEPNLVTCGFSVFGNVDINKNSFIDLPQEILDVTRIEEKGNSTEYELELISKHGYWSFHMKGTNEFISYIVISTMPY